MQEPAAAAISISSRGAGQQESWHRQCSSLTYCGLHDLVGALRVLRREHVLQVGSVAGEGDAAGGAHAGQRLQ